MLIRLLLAFLYTAICLPATAQLKRFSFTEQKMGSPFTIVMYGEDSTAAAMLARKSFQLVDSFVHIFSDYDSTSELMQLTSGEGSFKPVSPALMDILLQSKKAFEKTAGAFDITIGPLVKCWRAARKSKQFPPQEKIDSLKIFTGFDKLLIDTVEQKVKLTQKGMSLDLGGIAQGWIAQKVIDFLTSQNVSSVLVDVSGDISMSDAPPGTAGWSIGINVPGSKEGLLAQSLLLQHKSVSTSGDAWQFIEKNGKRYSHIVDPKTGYGVSFQRNVTVIANDATTADWLATACSILPIKKATKLAVKMNAELLIAENKKDKIVFYTTKGFSGYWNRMR